LLPPQWILEEVDSLAGTRRRRGSSREEIETEEREGY